MPSDSSEVDAAISAKLLGDSTLMAFATDGVFFDVAAQNATKFVIVSLVDEHDELMFNGRAYEDATYLIKAVALATTGADVKTAAARIDVLFDGGTMTVTGYSVMTIKRDARIRFTEVDEADRSIRWQHRGGRYRVMVSPS